MSYQEAIDEEMRLCLLKALYDMHDYQANDSVLKRIADASAFNRSRQNIVSQLKVLEDVGAVALDQRENATIATLTEKGRDHVERRIELTGVQRPDPPKV